MCGLNTLPFWISLTQKNCEVMLHVVFRSESYITYNYMYMYEPPDKLLVIVIHLLRRFIIVIRMSIKARNILESA